MVGFLVVNDHVTDPDPQVAAHHGKIEVVRDQTHTRTLPAASGRFLAGAGLEKSAMSRNPTLDFDEWFDAARRRIPGIMSENSLRSGPSIRGFRPKFLTDGSNPDRRFSSNCPRRQAHSDQFLDGDAR